MKKGLSLFWTTTADHHEDYFVVANSARQASEFHEGSVGYNPGDARSERLEAVDLIIRAPSYANRKLLAEMGYRAMTKHRPFVFAKHGRIFAAGDLGYRLLLDGARGKKGIYVVQAARTQQFKIGFTSDIEERLRKLQTGSPFRLHVRIFVACKRPKPLELAIHQLLEEKRASQEWFHLSRKDLRSLRMALWGLSQLSPTLRISDYDCFPEMP